MAWLNKVARRASGAAGRYAKRKTRSALPSYLTPESWDKPKKKKKKQSDSDWKKGKKLPKPDEKYNGWRFVGRSLGSVTRRLRGRGAKSTAPSAPSNRPSSSKQTKRNTIRVDPRLARTEAGYQARKEAKFRAATDYLFQVQLPSLPKKSLLLDRKTITERLAKAGRVPLSLSYKFR